jgi:hypothetical protein
MARFVTLPRRGGRETIAVNVERITYLEGYASGETRIHFDHNNFVVVDGTLDNITRAVAGE